VTPEEFKAFRENRYQYQLDWYDRKAGENQRHYRRMQWAVVVLAAVTPVLIEIEGAWIRSLHLPTVTSAVVAILTAGLKTFKYQENWINYRTTCETLRKEQYLYTAGLDEYRDAADKEAVFVERVEGLMSRENTKWVSTQKREKQTQDKTA